jgi:hypothetical protein
MMNFEWTGRIKKRRPFTAYSMHLITGNSPDADVVQIAHNLGGAFGADVSDDHLHDSPLSSGKTRAVSPAAKTPEKHCRGCGGSSTKLERQATDEAAIENSKFEYRNPKQFSKFQKFKSKLNGE